MASRRRAKQKGNKFELVVAKILTKWWGSQFRRTPQSGGSQLATEWRLAGDIATKDKTWPFGVEAKNQEDWIVAHLFTSDKCKPWKWWDQAVRQCLEGDEPLLVFKRNNFPVWIMMTEDCYLSHLDEFPDNVILLIDPCDVPVVVMLFDDFLKTEPSDWRRTT